MAARTPKLSAADAEIDLVPMIDCIFLLLLFFMLCGRITMDQRTELITVPPARTAASIPVVAGWSRVVLNVFGSTQAGDPPQCAIRLDRHTWHSTGIGDYSAYRGLRDALDRVYDRAEKYSDPKGAPGLLLPKVVVEVRADGDTEYRVIEEIQQLLADGIDPADMLPRQARSSALSRSFSHVAFTVRRLGDR